MEEGLVKSEQQLAERLAGTLARRSLSDLVKTRMQVSLLVVDCSGSMAETTDKGERKIDALRTVVAEVRERVACKVLAFGHAWQPEIVDAVPEPSGGTPLHDAITTAKGHRATHLIVVSDGIPDSQTAALEAARDFGGKIDAVYVGPKGGPGPQFMQQLAGLTGGTSDALDLAQKELVGKRILGFLGAGQSQIEAGEVA
jgi:Mg-chelatase subunit ChlD